MAHHPYIVRVDDKLRIVESSFDGDPEKDFAVVISKTLYGDAVITGYVESVSCLEGWHVVPDYPKMKDGKAEWRVER